jgi:predicted CXXCH cytochrome family protein
MIRAAWWLLPLLSASLAFGQAPEPPAPAADPAAAEHPNPHFAPDRCDVCHAPTPPGATAEQMTWAAGTANDTCRTCHTTEHHQVGMKAHRRGQGSDEDVGRDRARVPAAFPLVDGEMACLTCHDEPTCEGSPQEPKNPRFFRGGPYGHLGGLCENCHAAAQTVRFNPHKAMEEKRDTTAICEFCHDLVDGKPDLELLKTDRVAICYGCHKDTRHTGSAEHLKTLDPGMKARAEAGELPLTPDGKVFCGTCHDPHPPGSKPSAMDRTEWAGKPLFTDPWLLSALEPILEERAETLGTDVTPWTKEPDFMRKPLSGNALCGTCHTPEDTEERRRRDGR